MKAQLAKFRSDNQKLRRENGRLRREIQKLNAYLGERDEFADDAPLPVVEPQDVPKPGCPECGADLQVLTLPHKTLKVCPECKWRRAE